MRLARFLSIFAFHLLALTVAAGAAEPAAAPKRPKPKIDGHWGEDAVGFRWEEADSLDGRWNRTDVGPFLCSALPTPTGMVNKSLAMRLGEKGEAAVCFDLQTLNVRCGWTGDYLQFDPARYGIIRPPAIGGTVAFTTPAGDAWSAPATWRGMYQNGRRLLLSYDVDGVAVLDSFWAIQRREETLFRRTLQLGPSDRSLNVVLAGAATPVVLAGGGGRAELDRRPNEPTRLVFHPSPEPTQVTIWLGTSGSQFEAPAAVATDLSELAGGATALWNHTIVTRGITRTTTETYAVDTISLPMQNPWRALIFVGGHDFFSTPGKAAICTMHGDVWIVDGIDARLDKLSWRRFATGLFQPLGLRIIDDRIYVLGRDQITRLHDRNGDGEADFYEAFNSDANTSAGGHDYSTCLETDPQGNFYYVSEQGVHRIAADGRSFETLATGLRNPNGLGVGPRGTITAAPQEGEWTPGSAIYEITPGGYYGYGGPRATPARPLGYDPPLLWLPRLVDNSSGGQVWVPDDRWGPLAGRMLHLSFGQCRLLLTLLEPRGGEYPSAWPLLAEEDEGKPSRPMDPTGAAGNVERHYLQGGSVTFPFSFDSGVMRGRFSPHDGQLYVSGLRGWASAATHDGCFQRVRYTGKPVHMPVAVRTLANGIALTFTTALDEQIAEDPDSYHVQQWNYRYGPQYGSPEYMVSQPDVEGRDEVSVQSATLIDPRTVFLELPDVQPVMQMAVTYLLRAADGATMRDTYYHTINVVPPRRMDPEQLTRRPRSGGLTRDLEQRLAPGLVWRFWPGSQANDDPIAATDVRAARTASLSVASGAAVTPFLDAGPFTARAEGYLHVPLRGTYTFSLRGRGAVRVRINGQEVLAAQGEDLSLADRRTFPLHKGYNGLEIFYTSAPEGEARLQVQWSESFATEPIPPQQLFHDSSDNRLQTARQLRSGRALYGSLRCHRCHGPASGARSGELTLAEETTDMPELLVDAPDLRSAGTRLNRAWMAQWLLAPETLRDRSSMPHLLQGDARQQRQQALDIAAFLASGNRDPAKKSVEAALERVENALAADSLDGEILFEQLGCIACHRFTPPDAADAFDRLSLAFVNQKYRPGQLQVYLKQPHAAYRATVMPDFHLSDEEAKALAGFLRTNGSSTLAEWASRSPADPARGEQLVMQLDCGRCHQMANHPTDARGPRFADRRAPQLFGRNNSSAIGCLADSPQSQHAGPRYSLDAAQRQALLRFLQTDGGSLHRHDKAESAERFTQRLSCSRCHTRDDQRSLRPTILAEEGSGRAPEPLPDLTWAGDKLNVHWLGDFLDGTIREPMRPWLEARMPAFPWYADVLAAGMAQQHGLSSDSSTNAAYSAELAEVGRRLTLATGLDCRQCHGVGDLQPRGDDRTQIALGINFAHIRQRLNYDYYRRFVLDPPRYDISTKMPKLAADGHTTKITEVYEGDARRQFDAIWQYLRFFDKLETQTTRAASP